MRIGHGGSSASATAKQAAHVRSCGRHIAGSRRLVDDRRRVVAVEPTDQAANVSTGCRHIPARRVEAQGPVLHLSDQSAHLTASRHRARSAAARDVGLVLAEADQASHVVEGRRDIA